MKVLAVSDKITVSEKNNQQYHNCRITVGVPQDYEGTTVLSKYQVVLSHKAVIDAINQYHLNSIEDLKGHEVDCYRKAPIFLDKYEKQFAIVKCDVVQVRK